MCHTFIINAVKYNVRTVQSSILCTRLFFLFLVNDQRDAQILFYVFISIYNSMLVAEMYAGWKKTSSNLYTSRPPT